KFDIYICYYFLNKHQKFNLFLFGIISVTLHNQLASISRGENSIFETLKKNGVVDPEKYIGFYSLRAYDKIDPQSVKKGLGVLKEESEEKSKTVEEVTTNSTDSPAYVTELVYVHSKLMIIG